MITSEQVRAARGLLRITQGELATKAGLSVETIKRLESMAGVISTFSSTEAAIRLAFAELGVEFIDENGGGRGVRFRRPGDAGSPYIVLD